MELQKIEAPDLSLRFFGQSAPCANPREVFDAVERELNFSQYWVPNPKYSYSVVATGDSMIHARIFPGDMLVIDCSAEPKADCIVAAWLNGDLTVKRLSSDEEGNPLLMPENEHYSPIRVSSMDDFRILGVVTSVHRKLY